MYYDQSRYFNVTDAFCAFCGIYGISDLESRLKVIQGHWFLHQSKARKRVYDFLLLLNSNLGPILLSFRDITAFRRPNPLFSTPPLFGQKCRGVPLGVDLSYWGCKERKSQATNAMVKLLLKISNSNLCDHDTSTLRTDGQFAIAIPRSA